MARYMLLPSYVGAKAAYVSKISALFDEQCTEYVEPCAGSGALFFSLYNNRYKEYTLGEVNVNLLYLYKALISDRTRDETVRKICKLEKPDDKEIAKEQFNEAKGKLLMGKLSNPTDEQIIQAAVNTYLVYSQSFNCGAKTYSSLKSNDKYMAEVRYSINLAAEKLRVVQPKLKYCDVRKLVPQCDDPKVQMFIDPPYVGMYRDSDKLYQQEMSELIKHILLAEKLNDTKAAVVLCGYRSTNPEIPTVYDALLGDHWHCFKLADTFKKCKVVKVGEPKPKAEEYVWTNRVPEGAATYISMVDYKEKINIKEYWKKIRTACKNNLVGYKHKKEYINTYKFMYNRDLL